MDSLPPATVVATVDSPPRSDRVIAVVLLVALGVLSPVVSVMGLLLAMVSDSCGASASCSYDQIGYGIVLAALAPWVGLLAGVVMVVRRVRRGRTVWWVPLLGALVGAGLFAMGAVLAATGVG